jgi:hypothetical protein
MTLSPTSSPTTTVPLLPMVPGDRAARLYSGYVALSAVGHGPPWGDIDVQPAVFPTRTVDELSGSGFAGRLELGVMWRRWGRFSVLAEAGPSQPGPLLPVGSTAESQTLGAGVQVGAADAPWELAPFAAFSARLREMQYLVGVDRMNSTTFSVGQSVGVEMRLGSNLVARVGFEAWRAGTGVSARGGFVDVKRYAWRSNGGPIVSDSEQLACFAGLLYEGFRQ